MNLMLGKYFANPWVKRILVVLVFVVMNLTYNADEILFLRPQSLHIWRQTNGLSIAKIYSQEGNSFWEPEMHSHYGNGGLTGKAAGEFPIIYYLVGKIWQVFGAHEWIYRLIHLIIYLIGFILLFDILEYFLKNIVWSGFVSLLLYTSPMNVYFGLNFLPDLPSVSFIIIASFFIFRFYFLKKNYLLWLAALFFFLGIGIKITSALTFIAFIGWIVFEFLFLPKEKRIFNFRIIQLIPFTCVILFVAAWYIYAGYYNSLNGGGYSYHGILPIWNESKERFLQVVDAFSKLIFKQFFWSYMQFLSIAIWLFLLMRIRKLPLILRYFLIVMPLGFLGYLILWFDVLDGHDYYFITATIVMVLVWGALFYYLKNVKFFRSLLSQLVFIAFFVLNIYSCKQRVDEHYTGWMNSLYENNFKAVGELEPYLEKLGIGKDDMVISIPDYTINGTLYYMNRKGYTDYASDFTKDEEFRKRITQGAKYLIVNDTTILQNQVLASYITHQIGEYKNVLIFDLRGGSGN